MAIVRGATPTSGATAIVADPDRDMVYVVDVASRTVTASIAFLPGDEPGRVVVDANRRAHVALRGGGALASIDIGSGALVQRRSVCAAPRGLAYDPVADALHVACATGELVTFPAGAGDATRRVTLDLDLRDVVVNQAAKTLTVSRFRSAELLTIAADGTVSSRSKAPDLITPFMVPRVAWRMIDNPAGDGALVVHQRASGSIDNRENLDHSAVAGLGGGYTSSSGGCSAFTSSKDAVAASVTELGVTPRSIVIPGLVLPIDIAANSSGNRIAVVAAGNGHSTNADALFMIDSASIPLGSDGCASHSALRHVAGQLTSVAFADDQTIVAFQREPAALVIVPLSEALPIAAIPLSTVSREDTGHAVFHSNSGAGIACASCHAEGGDDGMVWTFTEQGARRTPSLKGTLAGTAPYHWSGDIAGTQALVHKVYIEGMNGPSLGPDQTDALEGWLFALPAPATLSSTDAAAVLHGRALFEGTAGCTACHSGQKFTNNTTVDVGTGGSFQVPSLVGVAHRAPFLHDGCATTLADRFGACGGGPSHGKAAGLAASDVADLVTYLTTL